MINTAQHLASASAEVHKCVTIRGAVPGAGDLKFMDHLQKKYSKQLGFLPTMALEKKIERGEVSIAFENDEPAAYLLGNGNYLRDPHFGIIYQAAVSYDARRRLLGTALVQHFIDNVVREARLIGLWCAQDIEANEFWSACGFEAIAARHGSRRKGRVHIFWVGRTPKYPHEPLRYPRFTRGGLMREAREVFGLEPAAGNGSSYKEIVLPPPEVPDSPTSPKTDRKSTRMGGRRRAKGREVQSLTDAQRAFRYGAGKHIAVVIAGVTKYLPVAPMDLPNFTDLARVFVGVGEAVNSKVGKSNGVAPPPKGPLWTPAKRAA